VKSAAHLSALDEAEVLDALYEQANRVIKRVRCMSSAYDAK
jgi:hypothetical protein